MLFQWMLFESMTLVERPLDAKTVEENTTLLYATALLTMRDPPNNERSTKQDTTPASPT